MMDVMAILPSPRLLLHQVHLSLRRPRLLQLQLHLRQSPQAVLSPKAMTFHLHLHLHLRRRLPHLRLRLLPRLSLLHRLPPPQPVAVAMAVMYIREECTYLVFVLFRLLTVFLEPHFSFRMASPVLAARYIRIPTWLLRWVSVP